MTSLSSWASTVTVSSTGHDLTTLTNVRPALPKGGHFITHQGYDVAGSQLWFEFDLEYLTKVHLRGRANVQRDVQQAENCWLR